MRLHVLVPALRRRVSPRGSTRFFCCIARMLATACIVVAGAAAPALAYSPPKAAIIIDANSGTTLHARNARASRYPASLTKVMTLYIVFEYLRDGRLDLTTRLTVSATAAKRPPSKIGFKPGGSLSVRDAIRLLVTKSANDVAAAVAENIAGSEANFAKLMTRKARAMGMTDTTFRNASGLPHSGQKTTAYDMTILARRVLSDFPEYANVFKRRYAKFRGKTYRSHNRLLFSYDGMLGMKTGFIRASGFNVMIAAQRGKKRIFGVVMGGASSRARDARARALLDAAWARASVRAPAMTAHLPQRNPAFRSSERERAIRRRLASAEGPPEAMLFKHLETSAPLQARRAPAQRGRRKIQARLGANQAPEPRTQPRPQPRGSAATQSLAGPYHVQVGAYVSPEDARARLRSVSAKANALLGGYPHDAVPAEVGGRDVFRARFGGFNKVRARQACATLKQRAVDCLVMAAN